MNEQDILTSLLGPQGETDRRAGTLEGASSGCPQTEKAISQPISWLQRPLEGCSQWKGPRGGPSLPRVLSPLRGTARTLQMGAGRGQLPRRLQILHLN